LLSDTYSHGSILKYFSGIDHENIGKIMSKFEKLRQTLQLKITMDPRPMIIKQTEV
jgi:hypothetical protein